MRIGAILIGMSAVFFSPPHVFHVIQSAQQMLQLLHLWRQRFPLVQFHEEGELGQGSRIMTVSLCSDAHTASPLFHMVWVRQTHPPLALDGESGQGLLIAARLAPSQ